ncbi:hypothetical protein KM043_005891 [Ampulex compressa]|nr:hypothetical protein KM043_005891 [Ampulex compressa]
MRRSCEGGLERERGWFAVWQVDSLRRPGASKRPMIRSRHLRARDIDRWRFFPAQFQGFPEISRDLGSVAAAVHLASAWEKRARAADSKLRGWKLWDASKITRSLESGLTAFSKSHRRRLGPRYRQEGERKAESKEIRAKSALPASFPLPSTRMVGRFEEERAGKAGRGLKPEAEEPRKEGTSPRKDGTRARAATKREDTGAAPPRPTDLPTDTTVTNRERDPRKERLGENQERGSTMRDCKIPWRTE